MRTRYLLISCLIFFTSSLFAETAPEAKPRSSGWGRITFFQFANYTGRSFIVEGTGSLSNLKEKRRGSSGDWNNQISSVYIEGEMTATIYRDRDFNGPALKITKSIPNLRNGSTSMNWDDQASSVNYQPLDPDPIEVQAVFYENPGMSGRSFVIYAGEGISDLRDKRRGSVTKDWNDEIESFTLTGAAYVKLYDDKNYKGSWVLLKGSFKDLGSIGWSKRASSLKIIPAY